ncbi:hypothetical protein D8674_014536 [Pyrus ussuriensis x Pyrus communis]|uniref:Uncharacterized protein n=1 Tax=Pyrus ussuriensis x Pyrus communis TaxID=2448454 RepID=A0A5N5GU36_9ROSA|nr:hypothetical protein D8674_014536 [Pyrus ussuriensis x Pyrus communis]
MTDSTPDSMKSCEGEGSREGKEIFFFNSLLLLKFCGRKKMRKAMLRIERFDIGGLVQNQCSTKFKSWKMVPKELKKSMVGGWKFNVHRAAEHRGVPDATVDAPEEED